MQIVEMDWSNPAHCKAALEINVALQNEGYQRHNLVMPADHLRNMQEKLVADLRRRGNIRLFLAQEGEDWLGLLLCELRYSTYKLQGTLYCEDLWVKPEFRRQGVARCFIEQAIDYAKAQHLARVELTTTANNKAAGALYQEFGFSCARPIAEGTLAEDLLARGYEPGEFAIVLKLNLD